MDKEKILEGIRYILKDRLEIIHDASEVDDETDLIKTLGIDSVNIINLVVELEEYFEVDMGSEEISFEILTKLPFLIRNIEQQKQC